MKILIFIGKIFAVILLFIVFIYAGVCYLIHEMSGAGYRWASKVIDGDWGDWL